MILYAFLDENGIPTGGGIRSALPENAVAVPSIYQLGDLVKLQCIDGVWSEREFVPDSVPSEEDLFAVDLVRISNYINEYTSLFRKQFVTDITGQEMIYSEKRSEAVAYIKAAMESGEPETLDQYPFMSREVGITAQSAWQLAQIWLFMSDQWLMIGSVSEQIRQTALTALSSATTRQELDTIKDDFVTALAALT